MTDPTPTACPACEGPLEPNERGDVLRCPACNWPVYLLAARGYWIECPPPSQETDTRLDALWASVFRAALRTERPVPVEAL